MTGYFICKCGAQWWADPRDGDCPACKTIAELRAVVDAARIVKNNAHFARYGEDLVKNHAMERLDQALDNLKENQP
jgi:hypothetical protein